MLAVTMDAFYCDHFALPLPPGHRFPMAKYAQLRARVTAEGLLDPKDLHVPEAANDEQLLTVHTPDYLDKVVHGKLSEREIRRIGFPWSLELVERSRRSVGGTLAACRSSLRHGIAANLAGGTHHAFPDHGEGFCVFNDVAVAIRSLQRSGDIRSAVVIDCDVHQGNGTAAIFQRDDTVFTFSMHADHNFPFHKEHSDLDVPLADDTGDSTYLALLEESLTRVLSLARFDLAVYVAGADTYAGDRLGKMHLSKAGLRARDRWVLAACHEAQVPAAIVMGGGYARDVDDIVDIHLGTLAEAVEVLNTTHPEAGGHPSAPL